MSEGPFYETAGERRHGSVTKSDLEHLMAVKTVRSVMDIRSKFGGWLAVSSAGITSSQQVLKNAAFDIGGDDRYVAK